MQPDEVKQLLIDHLDNCEVMVSGDGSHFDIKVVGEVFDGMTMVAEQKLVYAALNDQITSGAIHAVNIKCYTPAEWETASKLQVG